MNINCSRVFQKTESLKAKSFCLRVDERLSVQICVNKLEGRVFNASELNKLQLIHRDFILVILYIDYNVFKPFQALFQALYWLQWLPVYKLNLLIDLPIFDKIVR